jgi:hypothetical protein
MLLGCVIHATLPYVTPEFLFKDPPTHVAFDVLATAIRGFRTPVFFVLAGFFAALLCERRGALGLLRSRALRVVLPLLVGLLVLGPATTAAHTFAVGCEASGSVRGGLDALAVGEWVRWDKAYHLWFLISLAGLYPLVIGLTWLVQRVPASGRAPLVRALRRAIASPWRAGFLALTVGTMMVPAELARSSLGKGTFLQLAMLAYFGFGWLLYGWRDLLPKLERRPFVPLLIGLALLPATTWALRETTQHPYGEAVLASRVGGAIFAAYSACMVLGVLGLFLKYAERPSRVARYASDASYWVYLAHYPLVIALGGVLAPLALPAGLKFVLVVGIAAPTLFLTYHLFVRYTLIGVFLNGRRAERSGHRPVPQTS